MTATTSKRYRERHADKIRAASAEWRKNNAAKRRAHNAVQTAMRTGRLSAPVLCEHCDEPKPLHAHHEDYAKPLDVMWLCHACHQRQHGRVLKPKRVLVGREVGGVKLTEQQVITIRSLAGHAPKAQIARCYGISESNVRQIIAWQTWKHL